MVKLWESRDDPLWRHIYKIIHSWIHGIIRSKYPRLFFNNNVAIY